MNGAGPVEDLDSLVDRLAAEPRPEPRPEPPQLGEERETLEETARHAGQLDILVELLDGRTGE